MHALPDVIELPIPSDAANESAEFRDDFPCRVVYSASHRITVAKRAVNHRRHMRQPAFPLDQTGSGCKPEMGLQGTPTNVYVQYRNPSRPAYHGGTATRHDEVSNQDALHP